MNKEQAITYLKFSGFSDEQIRTIEGAFTCDKCVYSTSEGCQYDDITETIPPFDDCISRQAAKKALEDRFMELQKRHSADKYETNFCLNTILELPPVNPQKPICPSAGIDCEDCPAYEKKSECEHDHEILKAYSDGASAVLDNVRAEIDGLLNDEDNSMYAHGVMDCLEIIDKFMAEGSGS